MSVPFWREPRGGYRCNICQSGAADFQVKTSRRNRCAIALIPSKMAVDADAVMLVHKLMDALPEELRQPLALSAVDEMSSKEIAAVLGIPEGTVRTRLMRGREILREKLTAVLDGRYAK